MPNFKTHCAISKIRIGNDFADLHRWIDEPQEEFGQDHRILRHSYNEGDKNYIKEYWDSRGGLGEKAVIEWLFHIATDNLATAYSMSKKDFSYGYKTYNLMQFGFSETGFIHCSFSRVNEQELDSVFEDELDEEELTS